MRSVKLIIAFLLAAVAVQAQYVQPMGYREYSFPYHVNIGVGLPARATTGSAYLEIGPTSGANRGLLPPRMTTTLMNAIASPANGLFIYNTDSLKYMYYNGSAWAVVGTGSGGGSTDTTSLSNRINLKLNISDTASMLSGYVKDRGFGLLKTGQNLYSDTTSGGVTSWVRTKKVIDSLSAAGWSPQGLQSALTVDPNLTTDHALDFNGNDFSIDGGNVISIASNGAGSGGQRVDFSAANSVNGQSSRVEVYGDSINLKPGTSGALNIDSLRTWNNIADTVRKKPMTWNKDNGAWEYLDFWPTGGGSSGLTIGTTTITSGSTKRILYDSAAVLSSNAQFVWDFTNKRLGIGTESPSLPLHVYESTTNTTTAGARIENASTGDAVLHFLRGSANFSAGIDQSGSDRFKISANATLGTTNGIEIASDGSIGLAGASVGAKVSFPAGSASAFTAPTKYTSGTLNTTAEAGANEYNGNFYDTKVNAVRFARGGTLKTNTTDVGNVGTGVDDLQSFSIPAGTLSADGDFIEYEFVITFAANANNKTVRIVYGATEIYNSTAQAQNGGTLIIEGKIIRTGATTQDVTAKISTDGTLFTDIASYTTAAETLSGAVTLKATGEATSDNDIISKILTVKFNGAN